MLENILALSFKFKHQYGLDLMSWPQGSEVWHQSKLGVISASNAWKVMSKGKGSAPSETRKTYMMDLVAQIASGQWEEINSKILEWGKLNEDGARSSYELITGNTIAEVSFAFKDESFRCGVSLDGITQNNVPVEYKCPWNSVHFLNFLLDDKLKKEYVWQCQFGMWVTGAKEYHVAQFDPRMKKTQFHYIEVLRDPEMQQQIDEEVPKFIEEMDAILARIGLCYGDQWKRLSK